MSGLKLHRLGQIMEPEPGNPMEVEGVLNPAAIRGPDGELYLFPRLVAKGNYSRIGIARVKFNKDGDPEGVERLGIALEPEADYELRPNGSGGCEDPRVTFIEPLQRYMMSYTAFSPNGPRTALAISTDLLVYARKTNARIELAKIFEKVKNAAYQIIQAKGATNYSIALALVKITQAIVRNENSILPVSTLITDFYGISDVCISIPALVNITGVEQYVKLNLSDQEQKLFKHSANTLKNLIKATDL